MRITVLLKVAGLALIAMYPGGCAYIFSGNTPMDSAAVTLTPFSGRFGYQLSSERFAFEGALTKEEVHSAVWNLEGNFTFPSSGYKVGAPMVQIAESYPEQVSVVLRVYAPPPGSIVADVITTGQVTAAIPASNEALFTIVIHVFAMPCCGHVPGLTKADQTNNR